MTQPMPVRAAQRRRGRDSLPPVPPLVPSLPRPSPHPGPHPEPHPEPHQEHGWHHRGRHPEHGWHHRGHHRRGRAKVWVNWVERIRWTRWNKSWRRWTLYEHQRPVSAAITASEAKGGVGAAASGGQQGSYLRRSPSRSNSMNSVTPGGAQLLIWRRRTALTTRRWRRCGKSVTNRARPKACLAGAVVSVMRVQVVRGHFHNSNWTVARLVVLVVQAPPCERRLDLPTCEGPALFTSATVTTVAVVLPRPLFPPS